MDPGGNLKALEEQCMCSICLHRIKDVATLKCGHSHCGRCLEPLIRPVPLLQANQEPSPSITCPICRKIHHFGKNETIQSLQKDAAVVSKLAVLEKVRPKTKEIVLEICQNCRFTDHKNAVYKCLSCDASLCQDCLDKHDSQEDRKNHFIALLEEGENGKSILLCKKHSFCLKYFCHANGCQQLICTDCVLSEHKRHEILTFHEAQERMFAELKNEITFTSPKFRNGEKMIQGAFSNCLKKFEGQEEILRNTIKERKMNILKQVTSSLDSAEQQVMTLYHKKLWEFQSSLQPKIDAIRRKQQKMASIDRTLELAEKEDDLSFLVKAEHLKTNMVEQKANAELNHGLQIDLKLVTKEMTKDHLFDIMKHVIGDFEVHDLAKGTSEVIPVQVAERDTKADKETQTICQMSNHENEIMKLIHESRDPKLSKKETDGRRDAIGGNDGFIGNLKQSDSKRSHDETNESGANNAKRARYGNKTDSNLSTKPKSGKHSRDSMSPRCSRNNISPRRSRNDMSPRRSRDNISPRHSRNNISPRRSRENISPRRSRDRISPRRSRDNISPRRSRNNISPRRSRDSISPRRSRGNISPRRSRDNISPSPYSNSSATNNGAHGGKPPDHSRSHSNHKSRSKHKDGGASGTNSARNSRTKSRQRSESRDGDSYYQPDSPNNWSSGESQDFMSGSPHSIGAPWSETSSSDESHSPQMVLNLICYRCGRTNHDFQDCFARRTIEGELIDDSIVRCYRCGRDHHMTVDCYANFDINHRKL